MNAAMGAALSGGRAPAAWARAVRAAAARGHALPRGAAWLPGLLAPAPRLRVGALFGATFAALSGGLGARTAAAQRAGAAGIGSGAASGAFGPAARRPASLAGAAKRADLPPLPSAAARHADLPLLQRLTSRFTGPGTSATHPAAAALRSTGAVMVGAAGAAASGPAHGGTSSQASQGAVTPAAMARGVTTRAAIVRAGVAGADASAAVAAGARAFGGAVRGRLVRRFAGARQRARPGSPAAAGLEPALARQWAAPLFGPTAPMALLQSALAAAHPNAATTPAPAGAARARTPAHGTDGAARPGTATGGRTFARTAAAHPDAATTPAPSGPIRTLPAFAAGAALAAAQAAPAARGRRLVGRFAFSPASGAAAALPSPPAGGAVAPPSLVPLLPPLVAPAAAESFGAPSGAALAMQSALARESAAHDDLLGLSFKIERILNEQARRHGIDV